MTNQTSPRDLDLLSVYLDGQLSQKDAARLEARIQADPELRSVYEGLRQTRELLRQLPTRRAPRNFRLTPQMVGIKPSLPRSFPLFRFASVFASVLLLIGYTVNLSASTASMAAPTMMNYDAQNPAAAEMATAEPAATEGITPKFAPSATEEIPAGATATTDIMSLAAPADDAATQQMDTFVVPEENTARSMPMPPALPIHPGWLFGLLGLAAVSGASAFIVRVRTLQQQITTKDMLLASLAFVLVLLLALGISSMSMP